ncbi:MAG: hypothetical protein J5920_03435 [Candidatus Methanomethylophilaceae archaeon]|nr:hypothetical protein [Candidatus Methanomethylophilaceae archaeon]
MAYETKIIDTPRTNELLSICRPMNYYRHKADINGICVELFSCRKEFIDMWSDNFYHMSDSVRSHARIYCIDDGTTELHAEYDISTYTIFLFNFDYYGWIKSVALGLAGNILEREHWVYSVHGAAIDIDGKGVTLIAPSKTGKTTQSWGLLREANSHLISDDWYFVQFGTGRPRITGSEKNCYIDADIGDVWEEYKPLVTGVKFDNKGRGIGNVRWVRGQGTVIPKTSMSIIILLKRDKEDPSIVSELSTDDALNYLESHDFCDPHQLIRDENSIGIRREFFSKYLSQCKVYMVNTTCSAEETQERIRLLIRQS